MPRSEADEKEIETDGSGCIFATSHTRAILQRAIDDNRRNGMTTYDILRPCATFVTCLVHRVELWVTSTPIGASATIHTYMLIARLCHQP
jgi:hypothetical protein